MIEFSAHLFPVPLRTMIANVQMYFSEGTYTFRCDKDKIIKKKQEEF